MVEMEWNELIRSACEHVVVLEAHPNVHSSSLRKRTLKSMSTTNRQINDNVFYSARYVCIARNFAVPFHPLINSYIY